MQEEFGDVGLTRQGHVAIVELQRPPHNFFDGNMLADIVRAVEMLDEDPACRAIVLAAAGKSFCGGANFAAVNAAETSDDGSDFTRTSGETYKKAVRLFAARKPIVGAIQGAAIGGGLGLALVPDFRVTCAEGRFAANFVKLGFHPGFGLTHTLPALIGRQKAAQMFYTGRRIDGETAYEWGLADVFTSAEDVRPAAIRLAEEIAENAPLAVMSTRATMRQDLADTIARQTAHELAEQTWLRRTDDHAEGVRAVAERRAGNFTGK